MNDSRMRVYFDYNATTPLAPEVLDAVARTARDLFGMHRRPLLRTTGESGG